MLTQDYIKRCARDAGFTLCGVARARVLDERAGYADGVKLDYLARSFDRRLDPESIIKGARTVIVCALAYPYKMSSEPRVASYAQMDEDYHVKIKRMLREVLARLGDVRGKVCCDTAPILEKAWAVEAGLGWQGRNSLLVNPLCGSFLLLGEIVIDAEADSYDEPFEGSGCGSCRACIDACPVGALSGRGVDTSLCISAMTVEQPRLYGTASTLVCGWIKGCDECQISCPYNKKFCC